MVFEQPKVEIIKLNSNDVIFSSVGADCSVDGKSSSISFCDGPQEMQASECTSPGMV